MIRRTVHEWKELPFGPDPDDPATIPEWAADRIAAVAKASPLAGKGGAGVLEHKRKSLRARAVVGVIAAEGCFLEILPKIDVSETGDGQDAAIRRQLIHMLAIALEVKIDVGSLTELDLQRESLLEILISIFVVKLANAVRQGIPRSYVGQTDDLRALRGSMDVVRQFTRHAVNPSKLACRFDERSPDIALNQIMKAATTRLRRVSRSNRNQRRLQNASFAYADISEVPTHRLAWDRVQLDRTNSRWRELVSLARLLLSGRFQTSTEGESIGFALLFDMNVLFENYIGQLVRRALRGSGLRVSVQGGRLYCLTEEETGRKVFQTKPDILIKRGSEVIHVIDTKWKRISSRLDDPKRGVSQADVYQMMAYGQIYKAERLTLLYPHHKDLSDGEGLQMRHRISDGLLRLEIQSFDVADGKEAVSRIQAFLMAYEAQGSTFAGYSFSPPI